MRFKKATFFTNKVLAHLNTKLLLCCVSRLGIICLNLFFLVFAWLYDKYSVKRLKFGQKVAAFFCHQSNDKGK